MISISHAVDVRNIEHVTQAAKKWSSKKSASVRVAAALARAAHTRIEGASSLTRRANIMSTCSDRLVYKYCPDCGAYHIAGTWLCRDKLCPLCQWRLTVQRYANMMQTMTQLLNMDSNLNVAMLTLTVRNCAPAELTHTLDMMQTAWAKLYKRRPVQAAVIGYARTLEITYNAVTETYHPHYHVLLIYRDRDTYIHQADWAQWWSLSLDAGYGAIVDVRKAYNPDDADDTADYIHAIAECSKYVTTVDIHAGVSDDALAHLALALSGRRTIYYGGCIKRVRAELALLDDDTVSDVTLSRDVCGNCGHTLNAAIYQWTQSGYNLWSVVQPPSNII